jgi:hypothetical protein
MKTPVTLLLSLTFLFSIFILTSCASSPGKTIYFYYKNGKEVGCNKKDCQLNKDKFYCEVFAETGTPPPNYTKNTSDTSSNVTRHKGTITDQFGGSTYSYNGTSRTQTDHMQKGLQSMSNALGNLAQKVQYEERLENRFRKCMNITMGYDIRKLPNLSSMRDELCSVRTVFWAGDDHCGMRTMDLLNKKSKEKYGQNSDIVFADDLKDAFVAYEKKDYETVLKLLSPLAEKGVDKAQFKFGVMYQNGYGVPQDYKEAVKWYRLSAEQGHAFGQLNLGVMYHNGQGVLQDYALAHMWFNLSGSNGNKKAVHNRDILEKKMSPTQIEKAQDMARNWKPKK